MEDVINEKALELHREQTVNDIIKLLEDNDKVACVRYTGYGKSYYIMKALIDKLQSNFLIIVPNNVLKHNYLGMYAKYSNVQVITNQALLNLSEDDMLILFGDVDYIIYDECHHIANNKWRKVLDDLTTVLDGVKVIGFTATPERRDSVNVVNNYFNGVQVEPLELLEGIEHKFLHKIQYIVAYAEIEDKYDERLNEIDRYNIKNLLNISNILKKYLSDDILGNNPKILVYVPNIKYIKETKEQCMKWFSVFDKYKINLYDIHSYKDSGTNRNILKAFKIDHNNTIDVMVSVDMLTEGLHLPDISIEIMLRKTKSPVKYFQQLGRVMNNKQPIVFDLINNSKHLYQMKREYALSYNGVNVDRNKVMFGDCINLIDETTDIQKILYKYRNTNRIDDMTRLAILNSIESGMSYTEVAQEYDIARATISKILREFNYKSFVIRSDEELRTIYENNKVYIDKSNGVVPRTKISEYLGISLLQLERLYNLVGIKKKRVFKQIEKSRDIQDKIIELYNNHKKKFRMRDITQQLNLTKREYEAYLRTDYVSSRINKVSQFNKDEVVLDYILKHKDKCKAELSRELNVGTSIINRVAKENNIDLPQGKPNRVITEEDENIMIEAYKKYGSFNKIHTLYGYHKATIKKCLIKYNMYKPKK